MSRHRAIRNLDLDEELADDYDDFEEPWAQASTSDLESLDAALEEVKSVLGNEASSGFTDREVKEALWDAYFDAQAVVSQLLEDKERREAREKKKAEDPTAMEEDEALPSALSLHALSLHPSGASRARGVAGLATRGRAGLAKRNLASLAPEGLPGVGRGRGVPLPLPRGGGAPAPAPSQAQAGGKLALLAAQRRAVKRPAEAEAAGPSGAQAATSNTASSAVSTAATATSRPSKLAALAAARSRPSSSAPTPSAAAASSSTSNDAAQASPAKPLSKLQLRAQASLAARQAQAAARAHGGSSAQADAVMAVDPAEAAREAEEAQGRQLLPGGIEARVLFPFRSAAKAHVSAAGDASPFADVLLGSSRSASSAAAAQSTATHARIPGGNPFDPVYGERAEKLRGVFEKPSPDDVVLKAREGTSLAK